MVRSNVALNWIWHPKRGVFLFLGLIAWMAVGCSRSEKSDASSQDSELSTVVDEVETPPVAVADVVQPDPHLANWHSPETCFECHQDVYHKWETSHHALAQRDLDPERDNAAFEPKEILDETGQVYLVKNSEENPFTLEAVYKDGAKEPEPAVATAVIGEDPIRQFLIDFPGGRKQTHALTWDPHKGEWFNVFGDEERNEGDWGHWTQQGMNWNANCASCHMTDYSKNYDMYSSSYTSEWKHAGITCIQCHQNMDKHVQAYRGGDVSAHPVTTNAEIHMENCASCHSRREELTADQFKPGDRFHNHFRLVLPDQPGAYFVDGQAREENYVYGSFKLSRMAEKGVSCLDCHDPHTNQTILPVQNNQLCLRCHSTGLKEATLIDPVAHSRHAEGSVGNQCVSCHMPERVYMQRDPRRDHGFTSPDPHLSIEYGVPNACSTCHQDQTTEWARDHFQAWYGESDKRKQARQRAHVLAEVEDGDLQSSADLLDLHGKETNAYWKTTWLRLLAPFASEQTVLELGLQSMNEGSPIERDAAVRILSNRQDRLEDLQNALGDPSRQVRLQAADVLLPMFNSGLLAFQEWQIYAEASADRPAGALRRAQLAAMQNDANLARLLARQATAMDANNPHLLYDAAIILDRIGNVDSALSNLAKAKRLDPDLAMVYYAEGLLYAEKGDLAASAQALREAVEKDPSQDRWWYNLSIANFQQGDLETARASLQKAIDLRPDEAAYRDFMRNLAAE